MKIERTKNATKNITVGTGLKLYQMLMPFLMRTAMIYFMGEKYLGLNSLFTSVLHILNLAELGVGNAMVFSMYKPIAEDDESTICALMRLYRRYYRLIGLVIGVLGLLLTPAIPYLIKEDVPPELNVYVLYLLNLGATVLTYWLFAYKNSLLQAHQRNDVANIVTVITTTVQYGIQLVAMIVWKNYYLHVMVALLTQALNNVITAAVATKMYPKYKPYGALSKERTKDLSRKIRDLFTGKLGSVVLNSSDSVVISAFLGLSMLVIYQNYYFILTSVIGIIETVLQSVTAGLGNSFITETKEKNYSDMKRFSFLFLWLIGVCACCFVGMYQPFMELWMGKARMLELGAVVCFVVYFFVYCFNRLLNIYKDAAGLWHADRFRPLITAGVNLTLNLILVQYWGVYGVLLSTVISMVAVGMPWLLHSIFTEFFPKAWRGEFLRQALMSTVLTAAACGLVHFACMPVNFGAVPTLLIRTLISVTVPNVLFYLTLRRHSQFRPGVRLLDRMTKHKLKLEATLFRRNG